MASALLGGFSRRLSVNEQEAPAVVPSVLQITAFVPAEIATPLQAHPEKYIQPAEPSNQGTAHHIFPLLPLTSTIPFAVLPSRQALSEEKVDQASSKDAVSTMPSVDEAKELSAVQTFTPPSSATVRIHDKVAGSQRLCCSSEKKQDPRQEFITMLQEGEATVLKAHGQMTAHAMVIPQTSTFREVWRLISAFDTHFAQMKLIAIEGDNLELALSCKKAS